jgi:hypothetical protein
MDSDSDESDGSVDRVQEPIAIPEGEVGLESSSDDAQQTHSHSEGYDELSQPSQALQHRLKGFLGERASTKLLENGGDASFRKVTIEIQVPLPERPWEYLRVPEVNTVEAVIEEVEHSGNELWYKVAFEDGREEDVSDLSSKWNYFFCEVISPPASGYLVHLNQSL